MSSAPSQITLELVPRARLDLIDVRDRTQAVSDLARAYPRCLYYSFHTTAGYLEQSLARRLNQGQGIGSFIDVFRSVFPEGAGYRHDELDERRDLSHEQRQVEPRNADSHLAFIAAGLRSCVSYANERPGPVCFIDLDGVCDGRPRRRLTSILGYTDEEQVAQVSLTVPVSRHPVDSVNLKDPRLGLYEQLDELIARHGVSKGRIRLELAVAERQAGLTVNEYETLLMQHDLADVLSDPLRFMLEKGRNIFADPRSIALRSLDYAKYDLVRAFNHLLDSLGLNESLVERAWARAISVPAARFLRMKRSINMLVSDLNGDGQGAIVEGRYQSPILVQWHPSRQATRQLHVTLTRFV